MSRPVGPRGDGRAMTEKGHLATADGRAQLAGPRDCGPPLSPRRGRVDKGESLTAQEQWIVGSPFHLGSTEPAARAGPAASKSEESPSFILH